jgi:hypothetical protein
LAPAPFSRRILAYSSLPRQDYHFFLSFHRIGARSAYLFVWYKSCECEAEDGRYKKDASDYSILNRIYIGINHVPVDWIAAMASMLLVE